MWPPPEMSAWHMTFLGHVPGAFLFPTVLVKKILPFLDDIFYWSGAVLISAGVYFIFPVGAWFVMGGFCLHFSYLFGRYRVKQ